MKMIKKVETSSLLDQSNALGNYLDEMLQVATKKPPVAVNEQPVKIDIRGDAQPVETEITVDTDSLTSVGLVAKIDVKPAVDIRSSGVVVDVEPEPVIQTGQLDISQFPIQCLMFRVAGNLLSLPLIQMSGVVCWTDELTRLPQSPDWMLGLVKHRDQNLGILDSSSVLGIPAITGQSPGHVLVLAGYDWALSCDALENVVKLEYDDIQWHQNTENTVSVGTIRTSLAYLLNPSGIVNSLNLSDQT
jgi:purine-binding chemotaxis protein CheW